MDIQKILISRNTALISFLALITLGFSGCALIFSETDTSNLPPQIELFSLNPESIENGQSALLSWEVTNAESVVIEPDLSNAALSGSQQVNPTQTTEYTILATNEFGTSKSAVTLSVTERASTELSGSPPSIISFKAHPKNVYAGAAVELSWEVTNATSISIEWENNLYDAGKKESGSIVLRPVVPTGYILRADNSSGTSVSATMVTIKSEAGSQGGPGGGGGGG